MHARVCVRAGARARARAGLWAGFARGASQLSDPASPLRPGQAHEAHRDPDHPCAAGDSPPKLTVSAPSTPLHCPGGDESSKSRLVGYALLQEKKTQDVQDDLEEPVQPTRQVSGGAEPAEESVHGNCNPANGGFPCSSSAPAALSEFCGGGQMSEAERRTAAEKLESELRWTEAALQSRVQHLIHTKQASLSATR